MKFITSKVISVLTLCLGTHVSPIFAAKMVNRELPSGPLNMGYISMCDAEKTIRAVQTGLNVLFWFSIDLASINGQPAVIPSVEQPLPDLACISKIVQEIAAMNLTTTHMVTVGGWGAPDPVTDFSSSEMWQAFKDWNQNVVEVAGIPGGFAGIDWDMEGANDPSESSNYLSMDMMDLVGEISQLAKKDGYIVSMVPPESYLDPTTSQFDGSLLHPYPEWEGIVDFNYHGHNGYAYLLAKYGQTPVESVDIKRKEETATMMTDTFDIVSIQLYESYSHIDYNTTAAAVNKLQTASEYLTLWIPRVLAGWYVDFAADPSYAASNLPSQSVSVGKTVFCIGLANGWAGNSKAVLVMPEEAGIAYESLKAWGMEPRGFVFWSVENEGVIPPGQSEPLYMAAGLNEFLHTRPQ